MELRIYGDHALGEYLSYRVLGNLKYTCIKKYCFYFYILIKCVYVK